MLDFKETAKRRDGDTASRRSAFTLVEMIVVITIMLILLVAAVAVAPRFTERQNVVSAADQISQWLLTARVRAMHDQVPTGVRLQARQDTATISQTPVPQPGVPTTISPAAMSGITPGGLPWTIPSPPSPSGPFPYVVVANPDGSNREAVPILANSGSSFVASFNFPHPAGLIIWVLAYSQELQYIQQPDDFIVQWPGNTPPVRSLALTTPVGGAVYAFADLQPAPPAIGPDFSGGLTNSTLWPVQPGDYLEILGMGLVHRIVQVGSSTPGFPSPTNPVIDRLIIDPTGAPTTSISSTTQYRIIRAPRALQGETPLDLPGKVVVDITYPKFPGYDPILPVDPLTGNVDIVFSPSGAVTGRGQGVDKIMLWVRDGTKVLDVNASGEMYLVTIQVRTGFIAVHPVDTNPPDPYFYARDNRSSGL